MLFLVGVIGAFFFLMLFSTIHYIVHQPSRYIPPAIITALVGALLICLIVAILD